MTRMPGVDWVPSPNHNTGETTRPPRGLVLHTADGTYEGTVAWQADPASQVSSFFVTAKDGRITQCVDLDDRAWTQGTGNADWIGIENEGHGEQGDALTDAQLDAIARIYAFVVQTWPGVPIQVTDNPFGNGIGWHGMGANIGWGHPACPGEVIKAQRQDICQRTHVLLGQTPPDPKKEPPMKFLFVDDVNVGVDGNHPRCAAVQEDGTIVLGNGANVGKPTTPYGPLTVVVSDMVAGWTFMGAADIRNAQGQCIGFRYEALDPQGQWHPYLYKFQA